MTRLAKSLAVVMLTALSALAAPAQRPPRPLPEATLPDTPAGRQAAALLQVFNTGDGRKMFAFIQERFTKEALAQRSAEQRIEMFGDLWIDTSGLIARKVESSDAHAITLVAQDKLAGDSVRLQIDVEANEPHGILDVRSQPTTPPSQVAAPRNDAELASAVKAYVEKLAAADVFSGTVLVAHGDKVVYQGAFGLASRAYGVPNRLNTRFNLGSMNKMFTSVAVAQLVEAGKLSYEDTVGKVLPDYPNKAVAEKVTVHQLLTHTSGLGDFFNDEYDKMDKSRLREVKDFLPLFVNEPLKFEPGTSWRYSNAGFILLGALVEKASGENYFDYVREHIYKPAGMKDTDAYELDREPVNLAVGYTTQGPGDRQSNTREWNNVFLHVVRGGPAGGGYSTVEDLWRFSRALQANKLLGARYTELVTTGKTKLGASKYAYGFRDAEVQGTRIVGHSGGFPGINSQLDIYLGKGYTVAVMSNYDPPAASRIADRIRSLLLPKR
jgi:CubicO group peptidase (beta-lactamase class C family)